MSPPLFHFGHGLTYTQFKFGPPRLERSTIRRDQSTRLLVEVSNVGPRQGDEVVQLYVRDLVSSATRPVKELKDFRA
jgi:beta-glucosidase